MKLSLDNAGDLYQIRAFARDTITINDLRCQASLIVSGHKLITDWPVTNIHALTVTDLETLTHLSAELCLLRTGAHLNFPHTSLNARYPQREIATAVMDTAAACRTYNVLISEGRAVAAALIIDNVLLPRD